jgi:GNAT superfamily N-acetyltransferase
MTENQAAPTINIDEQPDTALRDAILRPLREYNESKVGPITSQLVAVLLQHPENGEVIGGLWGRSVADWLFVDLLFVPEEFRGFGLGTALMKNAEAVAIKRGCVGVWLHTATFQAPHFYKKLGYQPFGKLPDYPRGFETIYYFKRLE